MARGSGRPLQGDFLFHHLTKAAGHRIQGKIADECFGEGWSSTLSRWLRGKQSPDDQNLRTAARCIFKGKVSDGDYPAIVSDFILSFDFLERVQNGRTRVDAEAPRLARQFIDEFEIRGPIGANQREEASAADSTDDALTSQGAVYESEGFSGPSKQKERGWQPPEIIWPDEFSSEDWLDPRNLAHIPFKGRKAELAALDDFIASESPFKVWAIIAPSGAGKTRLSNEWMRRSEALQGWRLCRLSSRDMSPEPWKEWMPDRPTLIVIDYIHGFEEVSRTIIDRSRQWGDQASLARVRLLVLDHVMPADFRDIARDKRFGFNELSLSIGQVRNIWHTGGPMLLGENNDQEHILRSVLAETSQKNKADQEVDLALNRLRGMTGAWHPLFAALIGAELSQKREFWSNSRRDLIHGYLAREGRMPPEIDDSPSAWAAMFVALATAKGQINFQELSDRKSINSTDSDINKAWSIAHTITSQKICYDLKKFQPDHLGQTHFIALIERILFFPTKIELLRNMLIELSDEKDEFQLTPLTQFIVNTLNALSQDDQNSQSTNYFWEIFLKFLEYLMSNNSETLSFSISISIHLASRSISNRCSSHISERAFSIIDYSSVEYCAYQTEDLIPSILLMVDSSDVIEAHIGDGKQLNSIINIIVRGVKHNHNVGIYCLYITAARGSKLFVDEILNAGADPNGIRLEGGGTPLTHAARDGSEKIVRTLIQAGARVDTLVGALGETALFFACYDGTYEVVTTLLSEKADPNLPRTSDGVTPLMIAAQEGRYDVVCALIDSDADPNLTSRDEDMSPLMLAAERGHLNVVEGLVTAKTNVGKERRKDGRTALFFASQKKKNHKIVEFLINSGAKANVKSTDGYTPLIIAAGLSDLSTVKLLLRKGAVLQSSRDRDSIAALVNACRNGKYRDYRIPFGARARS